MRVAGIGTGDDFGHAPRGGSTSWVVVGLDAAAVPCRRRNAAVCGGSGARCRCAARDHGSTDAPAGPQQLLVSSQPRPARTRVTSFGGSAAVPARPVSVATPRSADAVPLR